MSRGDEERLDDIAGAISSIRAHASNARANERLRRDAILYNLLILGEAVKATTDEIRAQHPEIPWRQIAGLRDLVAHEYYRLDMGVIQNIIERDLRPLEEAVAELRGARSRRMRRRRKRE